MQGVIVVCNVDLGPGDPGVSLTDGLAEGRHGEVGHGAALELNVDHLGVADVVVAVVNTAGSARY